jgi:hypothetical protein
MRQLRSDGGVPAGPLKSSRHSAAPAGRTTAAGGGVTAMSTTSRVGAASTNGIMVVRHRRGQAVTVRPRRASRGSSTISANALLNTSGNTTHRLSADGRPSAAAKVGWPARAVPVAAPITEAARLTAPYSPSSATLTDSKLLRVRPLVGAQPGRRRINTSSRPAACAVAVTTCAVPLAMPDAPVCSRFAAPAVTSPESRISKGTAGCVVTGDTRHMRWTAGNSDSARPPTEAR